MPYINKRKIYDRLPADTEEYLADPVGIMQATSALGHYMFNNDDYVVNKVNEARKSLADLRNSTKVKEAKQRLANVPNHLIHTDEGRNFLKHKYHSIIGLEDAKDIYLGYPQRSNSFTKATEVPKHGKLTNPHKSLYLSRNKWVFDNFLMPAYRNIFTKTINKNSNKLKPGDIQAIGSSGINGVTQLPILGNATVGYGIDNKKGPYISYYDNWDVALNGKSNAKDNVVSRMLHGKPFDVYDRIYLTDHYGLTLEDIIPKDKDAYYGGFLPELIVTKNHDKNRK